MKKTSYGIWLALCLICLSFNTSANNLRITDVSLTNETTLTFNISWENSWRVTSSPNNHDAVWIFVKQKECGGVRWQHANLSPNMSDHTGGGLLEVYVDGKDQGPYAKGVYVRRKTVGSGNIENQTVSIRLAEAWDDLNDFQVFGIEMVQIPEGEFYLGDGSTAPITTSAFKDGNTNNPYLVTSENAITVGNVVGSLYAHGAQPLALPASFPKGYKEIYCMKYEITQQQYVDFLNNISGDQAVVRAQITTDANVGVSYILTNNVYTTNNKFRAAGHLAWSDLLAFLDWSCLRPMTELEYEKICRGPEYPIAGQYPWGLTGTTAIVDVLTVANANTDAEVATNAISANQGIAQFTGGVGHMMRSGFAATANSIRIQAGATYYGEMEMAGNAVEQVVSAAHATGVLFTGEVGDGELDISGATRGMANVDNWPSQNVVPTTTNVSNGRGLRGGSYASAVALLRVSDRAEANLNTLARQLYLGGRGVR